MSEPGDPTAGGASGRPGARPGLWPTLALAVLVALRLVALLACDVATQDGPNHLAAARVLRDWERSPAYREAFVLDLDHDPTWAPEALLATLMRVLEPLAAERAFLVLYWLAWAVGAWVLARALARSAGSAAGEGAWAALLFAPYAFGAPFHLGFWGFQLGAALLPWGWALLCAPPERFGPGRALILAALALALEQSHPIPFLALVFVAGVLALRRAARRVVSWSRAALPLAALLPAALLFAAFLRRSMALGHAPHHTVTRDSFLVHDVLGSFDRDLEPLCRAWLALLAVLAASALLGRRRWRPSELRLPLVLLALAALAAHVAAPGELFRGRLLGPRLELVFAFALAGALATTRPAVRLRGAATLLGLAGGLLFLAADVAWYRRLAPLRAEYLGVLDELPEGSRLLALPFTVTTRDLAGEPVSDRARPFLHLSGVAAAERGLVDLTSLLAATEYSPVRYRPEVDPYRRLALGQRLEAVPPRIDLAGYRARGGRVDHVLLWQLDSPEVTREEREAFLAQLEGYELLRVSPLGMARLYGLRAP